MSFLQINVLLVIAFLALSGFDLPDHNLVIAKPLHPDRVKASTPDETTLMAVKMGWQVEELDDCHYRIRR